MLNFSWGGAFGQSACIWLSNFIGSIGLAFLIVFGLGAYAIWRLNPDFQQLELSVPGIGNFKVPNISFNYFKSSKVEGSEIEEESTIDSNDTTTNVQTLRPRDKEDNMILEDEMTSSDMIDFKLASPKIPSPRKKQTISDAQKETSLEINNMLEGHATVDQPDKIIEQNEVPLEPGLHIAEENRFHLEPFDPTQSLKKYDYPNLGLLIDYKKK